MPKDQDQDQDQNNIILKAQDEEYRQSLSENISPYYRDLFAAMLHSDPAIANEAFDKVMFERGLAVPYICDQYILSSYKTAESRKMRYYCIQLLSFSGVKAGSEIIELALSDEEPSVRKEALYAVEDLKLKDLLPMVRSRLQDLNQDVRRVAQEVYDYLLSM